MNYIGSKNKLSSWIKSVITKQVNEPLATLTFCDLFAGTGIMARTFKPYVHQVIANDTEYYSYVILQNYIGNHGIQKDALQRIKQLNELDSKKGFFSEEYGENGRANRLFFSQENAEKIETVRQQIEAWHKNEQIDQATYYFLLASLIESADKVANTAVVYGAFLKKLKKSAATPLVIKPSEVTFTGNKHQVFQADANELIKNIKGDILYLDPPYNARQYGANYHVLNTIAEHRKFTPRGKTGLRNYYKSDYCRKNKVEDTFDQLIKDAKFKHIFLSYNNEGLMRPEAIKKIMSNYGNYHLETKKYQRFKADKTENRNHKANSTTEYLHCLSKTGF